MAIKESVSNTGVGRSKSEKFTGKLTRCWRWSWINKPTQAFATCIKSRWSLVTAHLPDCLLNGSKIWGKFVVNDQSASYHATRSALEGLTRYYSVHLGKTGIRCNCILPNTIIKPENINYFTKENEERKTLESITPLARMGNSNDISSLALFLCSPESSFISGQIISVDGGLSNRSQESIANHYKK